MPNLKSAFAYCHRWWQGAEDEVSFLWNKCVVTQYKKTKQKQFPFDFFFQKVKDIFQSIIWEIEKAEGNVEDKSGCVIS